MEQNKSADVPTESGTLSGLLSYVQLEPLPKLLFDKIVEGTGSSEQVLEAAIGTALSADEDLD